MSFDRNFNRGFKAGIVIWGLSALFSIAVTVGVIIVAIHFISKWW